MCCIAFVSACRFGVVDRSILARSQRSLLRGRQTVLRAEDSGSCGGRTRDDIRKWPDASPVTLQDLTYVGVAVMAMQGRPGYTRIRAP
ncbi:hypothetical protein ACFU76_35945 [Streptomyces sp. NPDC057539]|uniref:hypothetical protein n=1 Tax=Streptomyces sp. NPDC057539 TaxID=3346159 RepID=UPI0036AAB5C7